MTLLQRRKPEIQRRDATGHLQAKYAADLRRRSRELAPRDGEDVAFLEVARTGEPLAETLGEEFLLAATTGENVVLESFNEGQPEEEGGPFVVTKARHEFARGRDRSNPRGATREPFPTALSGEAADETVEAVVVAAIDGDSIADDEDG